MSVSDYTIGVGPYTGSGPVQAVTFYSSWTLDKNLDDGCTFSFTIPGYSPEAAAISELDTDVWVYRDGLLDQRFRIVAISQTWGSSGEDVISVQAVCYRRLLATRYVQTPLVFNQVSQGEIIWQLIQHTQATVNGDLGITLGDAGPVVLRDRTYDVGQNILDIIVDLTNVIGGPTWDIDENLELIVSQAHLFPENVTPVVLGATASGLERPSAAAQFGNVALVSGNQQSTTTVIEEASGLSTDPRGRWERRASYPSVVLQNTLVNHARGLLSDYQSPTAIWAVDVVPDRFFGDCDYRLGEFVRVVQPASTAAPITVAAVSVLGQILAVQVEQDADGGVGVSMRVLEIVGDTPPVPPLFVSVVGAASDTTAGGYRTVVWNASGSITVDGGDLEVEYLVIAGGGGGGNGAADIGGGGGGAGGYRSSVIGENSGGGASAESTITLTPSSYTVTIGAGGSANTNGSNSVFGSITSTGGGLAKGADGTVGGNGGSGGGVAGNGNTPGTGTSGQGYAGSIGRGSYGSTACSAGGGGGAGGAGTRPVNDASTGAGGVGVASSITGSSVTRAVGGLGKSKTGTEVGANGSANTGNGAAGGGGQGGAGGAGGSGVVIVRWAV